MIHDLQINLKGEKKERVEWVNSFIQPTSYSSEQHHPRCGGFFVELHLMTVWECSRSGQSGLSSLMGKSLGIFLSIQTPLPSYSDIMRKLIFSCTWSKLAGVNAQKTIRNNCCWMLRTICPVPEVTSEVMEPMFCFCYKSKPCLSSPGDWWLFLCSWQSTGCGSHLSAK